ncbi:MAG: hypothetical protein P8Y25_03440 [Chromatiaceae bacterium]
MPALARDLVATAGDVAIGVSVGGAARLQAVPAAAKATGVVIKRHIVKCRIIQNLLWRIVNSEWRMVNSG